MQRDNIEPGTALPAATGLTSGAPQPANSSNASALTPAAQEALNIQLLSAAYTKTQAEIESLINQGGDVNFQYLQWPGMTPVYAAAYHDKESAVRFLIKMKADINKATIQTYDTPLGAAAYYGHTEMCRTLLELGAELILPPNKRGHTQLDCAAMTSDSVKRALITTMFIEHLAAKYNANKDPAIIAAIDATSQKHDATLRQKFDALTLSPEAKLAIEQQALATKLGKELSVAAETKDPAEIDRLLQEGADINFQNPDWLGVTALYRAVIFGREMNVKALIKWNADVNIVTTNSNDTPIGAATHKGQVEICRILLEHGADPELLNKRGQSAFDMSDLIQDRNTKEFILNLLIENALSRAANEALEEIDPTKRVRFLSIKQLELKYKKPLMLKFIMEAMKLKVPNDRIISMLWQNIANFNDANIKDDICNMISNTDDLETKIKLCETVLTDASSPLHYILNFSRFPSIKLANESSGRLKKVRQLLEETLIAHPALIHILNETTQTKFNKELCEAALANDTAKMRSLFKLGVNINYRDTTRLGCTPLMLAVIVGSNACVNELLIHNADHNIPASGGRAEHMLLAEKHLYRGARNQLQTFLLAQPDYSVDVTPSQYSQFIGNAKVINVLSLRTQALQVKSAPQTAPIMSEPVTAATIPPANSPPAYQSIYPSLHNLVSDSQPLHLPAPQPVPTIQVIRTVDDYFEMSAEEQARTINIQPSSPARLFFHAPSQVPAETASHNSNVVEADKSVEKPAPRVHVKKAQMILQ
jgi:ankyrin repeat protein